MPQKKTFPLFAITAFLVFAAFSIVLIGVTVFCFNRKSGRCVIDMQKIQELRLKKSE